MKLPSNKASFAILAIIILSTLIFISSDYLDKKTTVEEVGGAEIVVDTNIKDTAVNSDSDGDGLMNWEETLWDTDPNNPDTDGDGTDDLTEIRSSRNPNVAGPDDEDISPEERILEEIRQNSEVDQNSLTGQVAINLAENYFNLRGSGELDASLKRDLIEQIINESTIEIDLEQKYNLKNLTTFSEEDENYEDNLINYTKDILTAQFVILSLSEGMSYSETGESMIDLANALTLIKVPSEIASVHLELVNNLNNLGFVIKEFEKETKDPLYTMMLLPTYEDLILNIEDINNSIGSFLRSNDIIIEDNKIKIQND